MKKIIASLILASTTICSSAYAQSNAPNKVHGSEGMSGDPIMQVSLGTVVNFVPGYGDGGLRFYMDFLTGVKLNRSSTWTVALVFGASSDLNNGGIFVKPDIGVLFRDKVFFVDMTVGPDYLHGFDCCNKEYFGYHTAIQPGLRVGAFQIGVPMSIDQLVVWPSGMSVYSVGGSVGFQL